MNKRNIAVLAGLMTLGMVTFASEGEVIKAQDKKPLSIFNINDRVRFDENRLEVNGNLHLNENNRLELRVRNTSDISPMFGSETGGNSGRNEAGDRTEMRMRLYTDTNCEDLLVRTELKTNTYGGSGNTQYFRVQPTYYLYNSNNSFALVRGGFGYEHATGGAESYSFTASSENVYTFNQYFSVEGNVYYDYAFGGKDTEDNHNIAIEAYAYGNYPLYTENGYKVEALLEGGMDPYTFGARDFSDLNEVRSRSTENGVEKYVFYAQPSVKATKRLNENNFVYLQAGYYIETTDKNDKNGTDDYNDSGFLRVGFTSAF